MSNLLDSVKNGDKLAFEQLLEDYEPLIAAECTSVVAKFPDFADEAEEMRQEGRLALYKAAMAYKDGEVTFGLYAKICIKNRLISYLRKLRTAKKRQAKISAHPVGIRAEQSAACFLRSDDGKVYRELLEGLTSPYEKKVFCMYLDKMSYADIAASLGKSVKSVANAIARVRAKIRAHVDNAQK